MQTMGFTELPCLTHQPLEQGQTTVHALGMPLHAHNRLVLHTLYRLDNAVGSGSGHTESLSCISHRLMVEGVDSYLFLAIEGMQD